MTRKPLTPAQRRAMQAKNKSKQAKAAWSEIKKFSPIITDDSYTYADLDTVCSEPTKKDKNG